MTKTASPNKAKRYIIPLVLGTLIITAFLLQVVPIYSQVIRTNPDGSTSAILTTNDAYWHMRIIDNLAVNFPHLNKIDPYQLSPSGEPMDRIHMFDWIVAGVAWTVGLGHPTQTVIDVVAAFAPPLFAIGIWVLVFLIGAMLFAPWIGLLATALTMTLPGELMGRSGLGSTDVHVAEVFWLTLITYLLIRALRGSRHDWWAIGAGIAFGAYFGTWVGAMTQGFAVGAAFLVLLIACHLRDQPVKETAHTGVVFFGVAMLTILLFSPGLTYVAALWLAMLGILALGWLSHRMSREYPRALFLLVIVIALLVVFAAGKWIFPAQFEGVAANFTRFIPKVTQVSELQPLFAPNGQFTMSLAWLNFRVTFFVGLAGLAIAVVQCTRKHDPALTLLTVLGIMALAMTAAERRYGYYFTVDIALFSGYFVWLLAKGAWRAIRRPEATLSIAIVLCAVLVPNIKPAVDNASRVPFSVPPGWLDCLTWLKSNSPEPLLKGSDYYYAQYTDYRDKVDAREAYAVTAWTDYGYWITRIAHRQPYDNPGHLPLPDPAVFKILTTENEVELRELESQTRTRYLVLDYPTVMSKITGIFGYFGLGTDKYLGQYQMVENGKTRTVVLFYPEYYRMMMARLYWFNGQQVTPTKTTIVKVKETGGIPLVEKSWQSTTYESAVKFLTTNPGTRIVGTDPAVSPVPLEKLEGHELVHQWPVGNSPETVKVFKVGKWPVNIMHHMVINTTTSNYYPY